MKPVQRWIKGRSPRVLRALMALSLLFGSVVVLSVTTSTPALAATGGYPDSAATTIDASQYEWGYPCGGSGQPACISGWWAYLNGVKYGYLSPRGYAYRNCTDYVAWKLESQGISSSLVSGRGNGGSWDSSSTGVTITSTPEVGDAAVIHHVYSGDPFGHVAYVEAVQGSPGSYQVKVSQYNWNEDGNYSITGWEAASTYDNFVDFNGVGTTLGGGSGSGTSATARPSAVQYGGEMDVYVIGGDGNLWKDTYSGSSWSGFSSLGGGSLVGSPNAIVYTNGSYQEMDVFARGSDGHIYKDTWNGTSWSGLSSMGGTMTSNPAAMEYTPDSEMDVFAVGSGGIPYKDTWNGTSWSGWNSLGGTVGANPFALQYTNGSYAEMDVYMLATNNQLVKDTWNGSSWSGWNSLGTTNMTADPNAVQYGSEMDVYMPEGSDNQPMKDTYNGSSWGGWSGLSGTISGAMFGMKYTNGYSEMDVYALATNGQIVKDTWNGTSWSGWNSLGTATMASSPVAMEYTQGSYQEMDVFAVGGDGSVYKDTWNGTSWSGWNPL